MIGGSYSASSTVATDITSKASTAETNAETYADTHKVDKTNIYNGLDYVPAVDATDNKVLDARQGKALKDAIDVIDSNLNTASTGLVARVSATENAINTLNGDASTSGSVLSTVNAQIANVVNNAPEAFDTLKEIADWIGNNSDDALTMQQNIHNNASAIATLEGTINNKTTGLAATKSIADEALTKANAAATQTSLGALDTRVTALENEPKSATVVIDNTHITYNDGVPTSIGEIPSQDKDYLLQC